MQAKIKFHNVTLKKLDQTLQQNSALIGSKIKCLIGRNKKRSFLRSLPPPYSSYLMHTFNLLQFCLTSSNVIELTNGELCEALDQFEATMIEVSLVKCLFTWSFF